MKTLLFCLPNCPPSSSLSRLPVCQYGSYELMISRPRSGCPLATMIQQRPRPGLHELNMPFRSDLERGYGRIYRVEAQDQVDMRGGRFVEAQKSVPKPLPALPKDSISSRNSSITSSTSTLTHEKASSLNITLPPKRYIWLWRNLRWTLFSVYRRLNFLVILPNILVMIILGAQHNLLTLSPETTATAFAANVTAAILIRQELVINLLFAIFGKCPQSFPLRVRRLAAKIYHLGGVHSGAGIAAAVWFGILNVSVVNASNHIMPNWLKITVLVITVILDALLVGIIVLAHPALRARYHNAFEQVHRFAGWIAVGLFWAHFVLLSEASRKVQHPSPTIFEVFLKSPPFYLLITSTVSLAMPWLRLRKIPVHAEPLSNHAIRLHFTYTNLPLCAAPRISDAPLKEWHAFAGIPEEDGHGFSVIVSKAGDWTTKLIQSPPTKIWVRGIPTRGVLHIAPIFKSMVLVATGSGIGPVLSLLYARDLRCRILWSTPNPETTYQRSIIDHVRLADPNAMIINTTISGRPNLVKQAYKLYQDFNAEAVFIISNPRVTRNFVYALESRGVPTFAPIFDS